MADMKIDNIDFKALEEKDHAYLLMLKELVKAINALAAKL